MHTKTTRRHALAVIASAAAIAPTAAIAATQASAEPDPIFAAVAAWREAGRAHDEACDRSNDVPKDTFHAYHATAMAMAETVPTTMLGLAALLEITAHDNEGGDAPWQTVAIWSVAKALRTAAGGGPLYEPEPEEDEDDEEDVTNPKTGWAVLNHFGAQAPAPHITLTPCEVEARGWCIMAEAAGHHPYFFAGYAIDERTAHWAAEQVAVQTGCTVPPQTVLP